MIILSEVTDSSETKLLTPFKGPKIFITSSSFLTIIFFSVTLIPRFVGLLPFNTSLIEAKNSSADVPQLNLTSQ